MARSKPRRPASRQPRRAKPARDRLSRAVALSIAAEEVTESASKIARPSPWRSTAVEITIRLASRVRAEPSARLPASPVSCSGRIGTGVPPMPSTNGGGWSLTECPRSGCASSTAACGWLLIGRLFGRRMTYLRQIRWMSKPDSDLPLLGSRPVDSRRTTREIRNTIFMRSLHGPHSSCSRAYAGALSCPNNVNVSCAVLRHWLPAGAKPARLTVAPAGSRRSGSWR